MNALKSTVRQVFTDPPRDVYRRRGISVPVRVLLFCLVPHVWVGVGFIVAAVWIPSVQVFGHDVNGRIVRRDIGRSKKGNLHYYVRYAYSDGGREFTDDADVSEAGFSRGYAIGAPIRIRTLYALGHRSSTPLIPDHSSLSFPAALGFAMFWNTIVSVFFYSYCLSPLRERRLLRIGNVAMGRITGKEERRGKNTSYLVSYGFRLPDEGRDVSGKMTVRKEEYEFAKAGDDVTVFYDSGKPSRSIVFKYAQYGVRDAYGYEVMAS